MSDTKEQQMRQSAHGFIHSFGTKTPRELLDDYFRSDVREICEHGPEWAGTKLPFLGKTFKGTDACLDYFDLLSQTLKMLPGATLPSLEGVAVDARADCVTFELSNARWEAVNTGKSWTETNLHRLSGWDHTGQRFAKWEVFADPLSAWDAVQ